MKPIIGITTYQADRTKASTVGRGYIDSVYAAGGIPVLIPIIEDAKDYSPYMELIDGIIFTGGNDVAPYRYGENPIKELHSLSSNRDDYELTLFNLAYERKLPIFGICRGIQLINVALGGSLYQDLNRQIPESLGHYPSDTATDEYYHSVNIMKDSIMFDIFKEEKIFTNSFHHQSLKKLGKNLIATSYSEDRIIESIESTEDRYLIGVQWHPECLSKRHPIHLKLFSHFVNASISNKVIVQIKP